MLVVACLHRVLARSAGARGLPPESVLSRCVALVSPVDAARLGLHVTQEVFVSRGDHRAVVSVWPSSRIEPGYVALDDASLQALDITSSAPVTRMIPSTPHGTPVKTSGKKSSGKKSSSKKKRAQNSLLSTPSPSPRDGSANRRGGRSDSAPTPPAAPRQLTVQIAPLADPAPLASIVRLRAQGEVGTSEVAALAKRALQGRMVIPGAAVSVPVLGMPQWLRVVAVECTLDSKQGLGRVRAETKVVFGGVSAAPLSETKEACLPPLGGLEEQHKELLQLARAAVGENCERGGVLVHGPSGVGKSALARAVAAEMGAHVVAIHGAAVYADSAGGGGAAGLKDAFRWVSSSLPGVLILDNVDAFARGRGASVSDNRGDANDNSVVAELPSLGHDLARLLDHLTPGVFVIATTARLSSVDAALRRPGRLGVEVAIEVPGAPGRASILRAVCATARAAGGISFSSDDGDAMARAAYGCVGADFAGAWGRAVATAVQRTTSTDGEKPVVSAEDMQSALNATTPSALREVAVEVPTTRWADIGGQSSAKARLREAVELPLSDRGRAALAALNLDPPRGILLYGPPGCAKTLLARAVATESNANFISVRGPELLSKWVGASERAVREVFWRARAAAPAVVFFDEIDALAGSRDGHAGASAHSRVVAQLLSEMDGVGENVGAHGERVVVVAATNRPDLLDSALLRPGRIDVQIYVGLPDEEERESVLRVHTRKTPMAEDVCIRKLAQGDWTGGMSGAEIAAFVREAALAAMEEDPENASLVSASHFQTARERVSRRTSAEMVAFFEQYRQIVEL